MSWETQMPVLLPNRSAESQIDRLLDGALHAMDEWSESWDPDCSILEDQDGFTVQMALPGIEPGWIDAQVEHAVLRVKGEPRARHRSKRTGIREIFQRVSSRVHSRFRHMWTMKSPEPRVEMGF